MNTEFKKLTTEIDRFYDFLHYLSIRQIGINDNDYQIISCEIKENDEFDFLLKSMKSNLVIMLYNLVEATVRTTMYKYYDSFNNQKKDYVSAVEEMKKVWIKYSSQEFKENRLQKQVFELIESAVDKEYFISLDFEKFHLSGNADVREIKEILKNHGLRYDEKDFEECGGSLSSIKNMRNSLAHGNVSFEDNGKNLAVNDLLEYKKQTYKCLTYLMGIVEKDIKNTEFKDYLVKSKDNRIKYSKKRRKRVNRR